VSEENKLLARRALEEIYSKGDLDAVGELVHAEFLNREPAHPDLPVGPDSVRQTVAGLHTTFSDLRFEVHQEVAEGDRVVQLVTMSGRQTGPIMGRPPTGKEFSARQIHIWRVADGRLAEHWGVRDDLGLLTQLGLFPGWS
jgi:steroid delta-isomerase-like uncharacterized protein